MALSPVPFEIERHARGLDTLQRIGGPTAAAPLIALTDLAPDLVRFAIDFAYGEVLSRPGLTLRMRQLCTVAALSAMGTATFQLRWHIDGALNVGWRPVDLIDAVLHACEVTGSQAVDQSLGIAREVFDARVLGVGPEHSGLDQRTRAAIAVAALTAVATAPATLEAQIRAALDAGTSREDIVEVIEQMAVYAGFPAALNGLAAARGAFQGPRV